MDNLNTYGVNMSKKKEAPEIQLTYKDKEYSFKLEDLSPEAQMQYSRATQLSGEIAALRQQAGEKEFVAQKYIALVVEELKKDKK